MIYQEFKPNIQLSRFVECYWFAFSNKPPFREKESLIPDRTIELMFNFGDDYIHWQENASKPVKGSHVIGIRRKSLLITQSNKQFIFSIRFKLGGIYAFFKIPAHLFADNIYQIKDLFGNELDELEEKLFESENNQKRVELIDSFLLNKLRHNNDYDYVDNCIKEILFNDRIQVHDLAHQFNTTYKTLERRFNQVAGLTPSYLFKIKRFNKSLLNMYSCSQSSLTSIGYESGYYDQAHFIREFKQLTGLSPGKFLKEQYTIVQVIQPALAERMSKSYNL